MRILHRLDSPMTWGYSSPDTEQSWKPGEVRQVRAKVAQYLLSTFPEAFVEHGAMAPVSRDPVPVSEEDEVSAPQPAEDASEPPAEG